MDIDLPFASLMGLKVLEVTPEKVIAELPVRPELCTRPAILHGVALMAFADTLGAVATIANLGAGLSTTTLESKPNFFAGIPAAQTAPGELPPLHPGPHIGKHARRD